MPGPSRRHKHKLEPISVDEIMDNPAMGGLLSFLDVHPSARSADVEATSSLPQVIDPKLDSSASTVGTLATEDSLRGAVRLTPEDTLIPEVSLTPDVTLDTVVTLPTDVSQATVKGVRDRQPTVVRLATGHRLSPVYVDGRNQQVDPKYVRACNSIQDGHSPTEQMVYQNLCNLGSPGGDGYQVVSRGYDRIAHDNGLSKRNVQRVMESLIEKLAIEILESEISADRIGKTYKLWNPGQIMKRRSEAGLKWVYRNRTAVELVRVATVDSLTTGTRQAMDGRNQS